jgi:HEPN domain-containing protein
MNRCREYGRQLLLMARDDALAVTQHLNDPHLVDWILGFHAQQAIEKSIKAVLNHHDITYPRTHDLTELLGIARSHGIGIPQCGEEVAVLSAFGAELRYERTPKAAPLNRRLAGSWVQSFLDWAEGILGES